MYFILCVCVCVCFCVCIFSISFLEIFEAAGVLCISFSVDKTGYEIKSLFYDVFHNKSNIFPQEESVI